jgi:Putative metal-binding motif
MRTRRLLALPVIFAGLIVPASASAYTVTVNVHGAGKVEEVPNRFGEEKHQLDCSVSPTDKAESTVTNCVGGTASGLWNSGNIVKLLASVPDTSTAYARGWRFSHYTDGTAANQINCDPQGTTGTHTSAECEFQIFANLYIDLYFDDTHGPTDTTVTGGPTGTTNGTAPTFNFNAASDPDATFECWLDRPGSGDGTFAPCGGEFDKSEQYTVAGDGTYTFHVRSRDLSGNLGADTASDSRTFVLDTTAPAAPSITAAPDSVSNDTSPTFEFGGEAGASYQCALDSDTYSSCTSPHTFAGPLGDGAHTFKVRATDSVGNGPGAISTYTWTIDTAGPDTTLLTGPAAGSSSPATSATFTFSTPEGGATFQCRIDAEAFAPCTSPHSRTGLANGDHTFQVRAVDAAGNPDPSPASRTWNVNSLDADRDGHNRPQDCDDGNAAIHPGAVEVVDDGIDQDCKDGDLVNLDRDGDGIPRPADCDDANAAIRPGAFDVPEDGVIQDCDGTDARWQMPNSTLSYLFGFKGKRARAVRLEVGRVPAGGKVQVRCVGGRKKGCKFKQRSVAVRNQGAKLLKVVRKLRLKPGAVLEVRVSAPGMATKVSRFTIRKRPRQPRLKSGCLKPGATRLSTCA